MRDLRWVDQALCAQTDPEIFFIEKGGSTKDAKKVCASCEVRQQCLEWAIAEDVRGGVYGGMSDRQRYRVSRTTNEKDR